MRPVAFQGDFFGRPRRPKVDAAFTRRRGRLYVERKLHCAIARVLRDFAGREWRYTHLPMGEKCDPATAALLKAMGVTKGWPDFILVRCAGNGRGGAVCFLELKRRGEVLADEQAYLATHLMAAGCGYCMADNFKDATDALKDWGVIPRSISVQ